MGSDTSFIPPSPENTLDRSTNQDTAPVGLQLVLEKLSFGGTPVLENLHLTLQAGKITCLLGPSGVGKSSILKSISGFIPLEPGSEIRTSDGYPLNTRISYMDQHDLLLPWASVLDNLAIGARLRGEIPDIEKAGKLLDQVGLEGRAQNRPEALSGGMKQRVALARTLIDDYPVVLMDEPFSALDAISKFHLQALAAKLLIGKTVLLITHDPMEALRIGHVIHVLSGSPAVLSPPLIPEGELPRDPANEGLKHHYSEIMRSLALTESGQI
jgi:putative hydroxymethylpyrimidine transport system ATP-binding protein